MTLGEQQRLFTRLMGDLIQWTYSQPGYELTFGEALRTPEQAALNASSLEVKTQVFTLLNLPTEGLKAGTGISNSLHLDKLAVDFNLFIDGIYQTSSAAHKPLGDFWKSLHPLARWGGDFQPPSKPDGNHYSLEYGGRQ